MRTLTLLLIGAMASAASTHSVAAESATTASHTAQVEKAQALIDKVAIAYGGRERILAIPAFSQTYSEENPAVDQSPGTLPPWKIDKVAGESAIDVENEQFAERRFDATEVYNYDFTQLVTADGSYQVDYRGGTASVAPQLTYEGASPPYQRVTPVLLVRQLLQNAHRSLHLGTRQVDGIAHDAISLVMDSGPILSLYVNRTTHYLTASERVLPGAGRVEYRFLDYQKVDGVPFNRRFQLIVNGDLANERSIGGTTFITGKRATSAFKLAGDIKLLPAEQTAEATDEPATEGPTSTEVASGVQLIGEAGTYALFVEMADHVVAIGGTAGIAERMAVQRKTHSNKPIRYGVMTHHHSDHVLGAADYAAAGITVLAAAAHETIVRNAFGDNTTDFEAVNKRRDLSDDYRKLEIIDIGPTVHSEHLLVAWLPKERVIFQADHFGVRPDGSVGPANSNTRTFAEALKRNGLSPKIILSAHDETPATAKLLRKSLKLKPRPRPVRAAP